MCVFSACLESLCGYGTEAKIDKNKERDRTLETSFKLLVPAIPKSERTLKKIVLRYTAQLSFREIVSVYNPTSFRGILIRKKIT